MPLREYRVTTTVSLTRTHVVHAHNEAEAFALCDEMTFNAIDEDSVKYDHDVEYEVTAKGWTVQHLSQTRRTL